MLGSKGTFKPFNFQSQNAIILFTVYALATQVSLSRMHNLASHFSFNATLTILYKCMQPFHGQKFKVAQKLSTVPKKTGQTFRVCSKKGHNFIRRPSILVSMPFPTHLKYCHLTYIHPGATLIFIVQNGPLSIIGQKTSQFKSHQDFFMLKQKIIHKRK